MGQSASAPALASARDHPDIALLKNEMSYGFTNAEQRKTISDHANLFMAINDKSGNADLLSSFMERMGADCTYVSKIPTGMQTLYIQILQKISFVAPKLSREKPQAPSKDDPKSLRSVKGHFFKTEYGLLVKWCFFDLVTIVPERPWTVKDAALFLRTLESIKPIFSRLFTQVFDYLIDHAELKSCFSEGGKYKEYPSHFSDSVFLSLSKVVRPKEDFDNVERIIQYRYRLKYHFRYPMSSQQLFDTLSQELSFTTASDVVKS